jgi:hypothetical protein
MAKTKHLTEQYLMNQQKNSSQTHNPESAGLFSDPDMVHATLKNLAYLFIYLAGIFLLVKIFH